jgi:hypothetical protein
MPATPLRRMASLLRPYLGRWLLATALLLGGGGLNLVLPQGVRLALDQAVARGDLAYLDRLVAMAMGLFVLLGRVRHGAPRADDVAGRAGGSPISAS